MSCTITFNNRTYTEAQFKNFFTHNPILVTKLKEVKKVADALHEKDNKTLPDTLSIVSGGANGADKAWVDLAYAHGLHENNSEEITMEDYYNLSQEQKDVVEKEYRFIAEKIGREITPPTGGGILVRRDMMQVQAGKTTATIAVGTLKEVKTSEGIVHRVDGGTAYAAMKSVQLGIPTYFFNQATNKWVELGPNGVKRVLTSSTEIPLLDGSITLIGTRGLSEAGFDAMSKLLGENMRTPSDSINTKSEVIPELTFQTVDEIISKPTYQGLKLTVQGPNVKKVIPVELENNNEVILNVQALRELYDKKEWFNPIKQKDGSVSKDYKVEQFKTFDEFFNYVMLHEVSHSRLTKGKDESIGSYEDRVNAGAMEMYNKIKPNLPQKSTQKAKSKKDGPFIMNDDQAMARKEILDFLKDNKRQTHTLSGYAGTGKTTILNEILKSYKGDVVMSAPTNKAVSVMKSKSTGTIRTIHSLLGIKADLLIEDYDVNNPAFSQKEDDSTLSNIEDVLLIIDESSMLNDSLLETIQRDFLRKGSGNKILFVGDSAQLSPVGQNHPSRALTSSEAMSQLTIVERADNNAVLKESMYIRETGDFTYTSDMDAEGNGVVFTADETNFLETVKSIFAERLESNPMVLRVVAATNREVDTVNNYMYNYFYPNSELILNPGQIMMGNINWNSDAKGNKLIENSGDFKIISSRPGTKNLAGVEVAGEFIEVQNLNSKTTFKSFAVGENPIEVMHTIAGYSEHLKRLAQADNKQWGAYYIFQNSFIATSNITTNTGRTIFKPSLVPGYAHTIHKSQGGTYENIAVMTQGLDQVQNWDAKDKAQLRYVAATRAEKGVYVLSSINKMKAPTNNTREIKGIEQIITEGFFLNERVMRQPQGMPNITARFDMGYNFFIVNPQELNRLYQDKLWAQPFTAGDGSVVEPIPVTAFRNVDDFTSFMMAKKYFEAYNIRDESKENMAQWQARSYSYAFKTLEFNFGYKAETKIPTPKEESIEPIDVVTPVNPSNIEVPSAPTEGVITDSSNPFAGFSQSSGGFGSGRNIFQELQEKANATSTEESTITDYEQREFPNVKNC